MTSLLLTLTNSILFVSAAATLVYFLTRKMFGHDPREPPLAPQSIPFVGHILGLSRSSFNYYVDLSHQVDTPIFTITLPGQKMYIITQPELIQTVQKQHKILAFPPIEAKFASTVCGASAEAQAILDKNVNGDEGDHGLSMESYAAMRAALKPGEELDGMNRIMLQEVGKSLDALQPAKGEVKKLGLYTWLRDVITTATTRSVYGPMNPYDDKSIADAFWTYEKGLISILIGILPSLTARKPIAAREKVAAAFEAYYKANGHKQASGLAKRRYEAEANNNVPIADIARYEIGASIAVLVNTAPAAFWTLLLLHTEPEVLAEIRSEIDNCTRTSTNDKGLTTKTLDISTLKQSCPLLLSAYQEILRLYSMGTSVRQVMTDTYLSNFLLKKGAMIQMPSRVIHRSESLWGDDATKFNARRFLASEKSKRPKDVCFRAFGGGKTLCPGRHFATNEVLAAVACFIARFDLSPSTSSSSSSTTQRDGSGNPKWHLPTADKSNVAAVVLQPDYDVDVEVKTREGMEGVKWELELEVGEKIFAMVTEDSAEKEGE